MEKKNSLHDKRPQTLVEILGNGRMVIEHHRGIICYTHDEIWIKTTFGQLLVRGSELILCCIRREQLCIMGKIALLELKGRDACGSVE